MSGIKPAAQGRNKTAQELAADGAETRTQENRLGDRARAIFDKLCAEIGVPASEVLRLDVHPGDNGAIVVETVDRDAMERANARAEASKRLEL